MDAIRKHIQDTLAKMKVGHITTIYGWLVFRRSNGLWVIGKDSISIKTPGVGIDAAVNTFYA